MRHRDISTAIENEIAGRDRSAVLGEVTQVFTREDATDPGNVEVNVVTRTFSNELRRVAVGASDHRGHAITPQVGDAVLINFVRSESQAPVVTEVIPNNEHRVPFVRPGHWRHEWDHDSGENLYLEAEASDHSSGTPNVVRMGVKPDGLADPSTEVAVDNSGSSTQVRIETDGDITLSADGDIVIDEGGTPKSVLTEDAKFEYEDTTVEDTSDGSGTSSTTTKKTTTVSNGETTETKID